MPSKNRKKKKKKAVKPKEVEFEFSFTDITMVEADGDFSVVKKLMESDGAAYTVKDASGKQHTHKFGLGAHDWNIATTLTITSPFGVGVFELNLRADKSLYIINYVPSTSNIYHNPDMSALMRWSQQTGWKFPQPTSVLIRSNLSFWRYMWEALLIDSEYLDERYGKRKSLDIRNQPITDSNDESEGLEVHDG